MFAVIVVYSALLNCVAYNGDSKPCPPGMPKDAWTSFPCNFSSCLLATVFFLTMFAMSSCILSTFVGDNWIVNVEPLKSQPSISFLCSKSPSFCSNFFTDTGFSPECPDTDGGGKIACIPNSIALDRYRGVKGSLSNIMRGEGGQICCLVPTRLLSLG